jgi:hypothetical protein
MTERRKLLQSIAATAADYRVGELGPPTSEHVDRWVSQFDNSVQIGILREMNHVLDRTYFSLEQVAGFLEMLTKAEKLVGKDPRAFWSGVCFLDIQGGGNSQREMLELFTEVLRKSCSLNIRDCGKVPSTFIYLDDVIFTGNRVRRDLEEWIKTDAPADAKLHVVCIALHSGGQYYANDRIRMASRAAGKRLEVTWWRSIQLEDQKKNINRSDVLRPAEIPEDVAVKEYVKAMRYSPVLRRPGNVGTKGLFSSEEGRGLLEQEFLKAGVRIRQICQNLGDTQRPLGHSTLETLGFGSLIVTFRNCPNNAPLVLWVGDPWYPLFPRTTNSQTEVRRMFREFTTGGGN